MDTSWITVTGGLFLLVCTSMVTPSDVEQRLYHELLDNYDTCCRPVVNHSDPLLINMKLTFNRFHYDPEDNKMRVNVWSHQTWKDQYLQWETDPDVNGSYPLHDIRFESGRIWQPDIKLTTPLVWDSYDCQRGHKEDKTIIECSYTMASWVYDGFRIDLELTDEPDTTSSYVPNHKYELVKLKAKRVEHFLPCCPEPYPKIQYMVQIKPIVV